MIIGVGIDIIEIDRIQKAISDTKGFIDRVYSEKEREYIETRNNRAEVFAGNFAAKEAVVKALGLGIGEIGFKDVEILRDVLGKPYVTLYNKAKMMLSDNSTIHVSISHCHAYAVANATIESYKDNEFENIDSSMFSKAEL